MDNPVKNSKVILKYEADRKRRKEINLLHDQLEELTLALEELDYDDESRRDLEEHIRFTIERLKDLDGLGSKKYQSNKLDPNVFVKVGAVAGLGILVSLIELPGNLVNMRALKAIKPLVDLLKL